MSKFDKMIRTGDDPILKQVCATVQPGEDLAWMDLLERVARKSKRAVGLAAPQIGVAKRGIFILCADKNGAIRGQRMYNPEIVGHSTTTHIAPEGCLSYPGIYKPIKRWSSIDVQYQQYPSAKPITETLHGYRARVAQHEIDHTFGICKVGDNDYPADVSPEPVSKSEPLAGDEPLATFTIRRSPTAAMAALAAVGAMTIRSRRR